MTTHIDHRTIEAAMRRGRLERAIALRRMIRATAKSVQRLRCALGNAFRASAKADCA